MYWRDFIRGWILRRWRWHHIWKTLSTMLLPEEIEEQWHYWQLGNAQENQLRKLGHTSSDEIYAYECHLAAEEGNPIPSRPGGIRVVHQPPVPDRFALFLLHYLRDVVLRLWCDVTDHNWEDTSYGNEDSGEMSGYCKRCGYSFRTILY